MFAGVASAAVTFDPSCPFTPSNATGKCGFVGKGDVQTVLGYNNDKMQKNASKLAFTYSQPASQALSQDGTQAGTQAATQAGSQSATQAGTQSGSQSATQAGTQAATESLSEALSCEVD